MLNRIHCAARKHIDASYKWFDSRLDISNVHGRGGTFLMKTIITPAIWWIEHHLLIFLGRFLAAAAGRAGFAISFLQLSLCMEGAIGV